VLALQPLPPPAPIKDAAGLAVAAWSFAAQNQGFQWVTCPAPHLLGMVEAALTAARPPDVRFWTARATPREASLPLGQWAPFKKVPGVLLAVIPLDGRFSLYAHWGDWLPWSCAALALMGLAWAFRPSRSRIV
jgi:hypothetical protein